MSLVDENMHTWLATYHLHPVVFFKVVPRLPVFSRDTLVAVILFQPLFFIPPMIGTEEGKEIGRAGPGGMMDNTHVHVHE